MHNAAQESGTLTADALTQLFVSACRKDDCSSVVDEPVRPLVKAGPEQAAVQSFTKARIVAYSMKQRRTASRRCCILG